MYTLNILAANKTELIIPELFLSSHTKKSDLFRLAGYGLIICVALMPLADFLTIYARSIESSTFERVSLAYRTAIVIFACIVCISTAKRKKSYILKSFVLFQITIWLYPLFTQQIDISSTIESSMLLLKFYVIFLFFYGFTALLNSRLISNEQLTRITTFLIYVYSLAIVFGAVFGVALMRYYDTDRWGVKGIIISGNEASGVLLVSLAWSMLQFSRSQSRTLLPLVIAALLLSGTKSSIIGMLILFVGYYIAKGGISSIIKMCFSALLLILASGYFYLYFDAVQEAVAKSADYFEYQYYNFANKSLITLALSGRDLKLYTVYNEIINDYPVALFIGGFPVGSYSTEMDFFDLLALSGIFGVLIYTYYWLRIWKKQFIYNKFESRFRLAFVITFIALGFLGGHMFYSAVTAPLLASLAISFRENQIRNKRKTQRPLYIRRENLSPSI
ncbi:O-antigen ligase family protein [Pseudomonas helleri]|uniref:O-antigen ligase family protein n=1 Tax=Pseudomonas helleri TaxID=1608996 RepID=UPI0009E1EF49|nr:O-antigen ligase family protein [Pseudomonas helleri]